MIGAIGSASKILFGSIFIGTAMAFASAYLLKHLGLNRRPDLFFPTEVLVIILFPYVYSGQDICHPNPSIDSMFFAQFMLTSSPGQVHRVDARGGGAPFRYRFDPLLWHCHGALHDT